MDKELDELLDSALEDFDQKITLKDSVSKSAVSIERTDLYVDEELDYEDRPIPKQQPSVSTDPDFGFDLSDENLKLFEGIFKDAELGGDSGMKDFKNMFDVFQNSKDETTLLDNFQKIMSELVNEEAKLENDDEEFDGFENIEVDIIQERNFLKNLASAANQIPMDTIKILSEEVKKSNSANDNNEENSETKTKDQTPIQKVLEDLNKNSKKVLKNSNTSGAFPFGSDFISSLTQTLNVDDTEDGSIDNATSLMMQPILSMLFSKDILYPSLKLMSENYDKYLLDKKEVLSEEQLNKCQEQKNYINDMCRIYENQNENDNKEAKAEQLKNIFNLLEKCGMPPPELVPEINPFEDLGAKMNGCPIS